MKKIKLFTHTDLDGIGCAILGILAYGKDNINIEYCNYDDVNEKVKEFYMGAEKNEYDKIFITDISVNEKIATIIKQYYIDETYNPDIQLLDHHPTALELNKYDWAKVQINLNDKEKTSGTRMFYDYLKENRYLDSHAVVYNQYTNIETFVEIVRKYDIWQWKEENYLIPKQWNDLFYIMGREDFIESILYRLTHYDIFGFSDFDLQLLKYKQREIDNYIKSKDKELIVKDILGYKAGIIFGEQYHSEVGNRLSETHPELDFIVIINMSKAISYRNIGNKVDLGKDVAEIFEGGGHPNAAGSPISDEFRNKVINEIFNLKS
ncbi:DHH family phosphoesterase [Clostridium botulinum]|uniref:DHH family phosphoesterase n=1 Tax=Clostridium botulinum TaxID=1491 RepID=UPI000773FB0B|nr:hypothetical protein [Clostridium botulinum]APH20929.1 hypothetical protein NPD1_4227 [Clostridium botulinum]MBN3352146.1 hypothetical protein [Clostridium botulinum]MBN3379213.1 hypothetical protein [Clostridium botulinum]